MSWYWELRTGLGDDLLVGQSLAEGPSLDLETDRGYVDALRDSRRGGLSYHRVDTDGSVAFAYGKLRGTAITMQALSNDVKSWSQISILVWVLILICKLDRTYSLTPCALSICSS